MKEVKDIIIDLINYLFLTGLCIFCLVYYVFGNYLSFFTEYVKMFVPMAVFGVLLLIKVKTRRATIRKMRAEEVLDEETECLITEIERTRDKYVVWSLPFILLAVSIFNHDTDFVDFIQASVVFLIMIFWHKILFKNQAKLYITSREKIEDEFVTFTLPLIIIAIALAKRDVNLIDFSQAMVIFLVMYFWHKVLFKAGT